MVPNLDADGRPTDAEGATDDGDAPAPSPSPSPSKYAHHSICIETEADVELNSMPTRFNESSS